MLSMQSTFSPNGLKSQGVALAGRVVNQERWSRAETRVSELLAIVTPSRESETRRNAVISYIQRLLMSSVPCQVFTLGSASLKTYLPDGDIDLTVFGDHDQLLHDSFISKILHILQAQLNSHNSQFQVKEVEYIPAQVKIIKCIVDIFVVDISFNQLGGLCALCFLEEINGLISRDHLFKRSIILIKAWCYYESRILGSTHGLISTYALEILVLYLFNLYNKRFSGPLEVLYRFCDFFSKFDWDTYCISLRGPVPIVSLPNMQAEPPRRDSQDILLPELFLKNYECVYGYTSSFQGVQEQSFESKHMNIIDPLRPNNNLGKSICKGNFFRIRSAIALGATQLGKLLDCSEENLLAQLDFIFKNTWDRHGNGRWVPVSLYNSYLRNKNTGKELCQESEVEQAQASRNCNMFRSRDFPILEGTSKQEEITEPIGHSVKSNSGSSSSSCNVSSGQSSAGRNLRESKPAKTPASYAGAVKGKVTACNFGSSSSSSSSSSNVCRRSDKTPASYAGVLKGTVTTAYEHCNLPTETGTSNIELQNQSSLPHAFGSSETRFPFQHCNLPTETGTSNIQLQNHSDTSRVYSICQDETSEYSVTERSDILIGNFGSDWMNLQYGRFCQNAELHRALLYPPTNAPPLGFLEQIPWNWRPPGSMNVVARGAAPLVPEMPHTFAPPLFWPPNFSDRTRSFMPNLPSHRQSHNPRRFSSHRQDQRPRNLNSNSGEWFSSTGQVHHSRAERPGARKTWHRGECSNHAVNELAKSKGGSR